MANRLFLRDMFGKYSVVSAQPIALVFILINDIMNYAIPGRPLDHKLHVPLIFDAHASRQLVTF